MHCPVSVADLVIRLSAYSVEVHFDRWIPPILTIPGRVEGFSSPTLSLPGVIMAFVPQANIEVMCAEKSISPREPCRLARSEVEVGEPGTEGCCLDLLVENVTRRVQVRFQGW